MATGSLYSEHAGLHYTPELAVNHRVWVNVGKGGWVQRELQVTEWAQRTC